MDWIPFCCCVFASRHLILKRNKLNIVSAYNSHSPVSWFIFRQVSVVRFPLMFTWTWNRKPKRHWKRKFNYFTSSTPHANRLLAWSPTTFLCSNSLWGTISRAIYFWWKHLKWKEDLSFGSVESDAWLGLVVGKGLVIKQRSIKYSWYTVESFSITLLWNFRESLPVYTRTPFLLF